ncbi:MAG: tyrosine-type recombinase/integrase [Pirellulaceae bacterium]
MARQPKPWYRADRDAWFVTVNGTRHNLGSNKKHAFDRFYELMRQPQAAKVASQSFAAIADVFLDWVEKHRSPDTYVWYQYRIERFCQRYPDLVASEIRPFHVQQWVDSYPDFAKTSRRNYVRTVKRCMRWAKQQGYIAENPIADMELPGGENREVFVTSDEFDQLCGYIRDETFLQLCRVTFETGCRPQEILRVEARHFDAKNARWILPPSEAKGKAKPRIVYLTPYALDVTHLLIERFSSGKLFRNVHDKPWTTDAVNCAFIRLQIRMGKDAIAAKGLDVRQLLADELAASPGGPKTVKELSDRERAKRRNVICTRFAPKYSLYALRHSWATRALQSGLDALTVAILMGHNDPSTLSRVYQHLAHNPEHLRVQAQRAVSG